MRSGSGRMNHPSHDAATRGDGGNAMTDAVATPKAAMPKVGKIVVVALVIGLSIELIGVIPWVVLARLNLREHPEWPWAAATTGCWLVIMLGWLGGCGWPRSLSAFRQFHLRLWRPQRGAWSGGSLATILSLICAMVG